MEILQFVDFDGTPLEDVFTSFALAATEPERLEFGISPVNTSPEITFDLAGSTDLSVSISRLSVANGFATHELVYGNTAAKTGIYNIQLTATAGDYTTGRLYVFTTIVVPVPVL